MEAQAENSTEIIKKYFINIPFNIKAYIVLKRKLFNN